MTPTQDPAEDLFQTATVRTAWAALCFAAQYDHPDMYTAHTFCTFINVTEHCLLPIIVFKLPQQMSVLILTSCSLCCQAHWHQS